MRESIYVGRQNDILVSIAIPEDKGVWIVSSRMWLLAGVFDNYTVYVTVDSVIVFLSGTMYHWTVATILEESDSQHPVLSMVTVTRNVKEYFHITHEHSLFLREIYFTSCYLEHNSIKSCKIETKVIKTAREKENIPRS